MKTISNHRLIQLQICALVTLSIMYLIIVFLLSGCQDNNIEGLRQTSSGFKIIKTSATYYSLNDHYESGNYYTDFIERIDYQGTEKITKLSYTYKWSSDPATYGPYTIQSSDYNDNYSSNQGFRGTSSSSYVEISDYWGFGSATSIAITFTITTNANKTYTASYTLLKPTGAN